MRDECDEFDDSQTEREALLAQTGHNAALLPSSCVRFDLLSDSLQHQHQALSLLNGDWIAPAREDASCCEELCREIFGFPHNLLLSQGRLAEAALAALLVRRGSVVPANLAFPTTRIHQELRGGRSVETIVAAARDPAHPARFKGNVDLARLERLLARPTAKAIPYVCVELSVNEAGGQPVSLENLAAVRRLTERAGIRLILDASRILENAAQLEAPTQAKALLPRVREICALADGLTMSLTKDFPTPVGGLLALRDGALFEHALDFAMAIGDGLSLDARAGIAGALRHAQRDASYVLARMALVRRLHERLAAAGFPILEPCGGHAVFIRLAKLLPHLSAADFPAEALNREWFLRFGLRGSPHGDASQGTHMLRLAVPILTLNTEDLDEAAAQLCAWLPHAAQIGPLRIASAPKSPGGWFRARYALPAEAPVEA